MVDKLYIRDTEELIVDTSSNTVTVLVDTGSVKITNLDKTVVFADLREKEIFTLPIQTGVYVIKGYGAFSDVYLFRMFVY
jgi:hypothetical protein